jgi:hypothetical protein
LIARVYYREVFLNWRKWRESVAHRHADANAEAARRTEPEMSGNHRLLYKYLDERYADTVVLTYAEIEDILGFTLPDVARRTAEWWTNPDADTPSSGYAESWIRAHRTAKPNMLAGTVAFER